MPKKLPRKDQPSLFDALEPTDELGTNGHLQDTTSTFTDNLDRKSTRLNSSHSQISYAVFCLKKKKKKRKKIHQPSAGNRRLAFIRRCIPQRSLSIRTAPSTQLAADTVRTASPTVDVLSRILL